MNIRVATILLLGLTLASCSLDVPRIVDTPVRHGMTSKELIATFGAPLSIHTKPDGSQEWTYRFATTEQSSGTAAGWYDPRYSTGEDTSQSISFEKSVVHLSPALEVTGEIPEGRILGKR